MADVRTWPAVEYASVVKGITVTRSAEFVVDVKAGKTTFVIGVNQLRSLADAFNRVADEIEGK